MSYEILAQITEMRNCASTIEDNSEIIRREVEQVRELVSPLRQTFMGNRASDFFQKYDQAYDDMQQWDDIVRSFAEELRLAANALEAADNV